MIRVVSYTNAPQSKLMLNGKMVGDVKGLDDHTGVIYWDIPFQAGKLEVVGMDKNGKQTCNYLLESSARPFALTARSDLSILKKDRRVAQVIVQVVDEKGLPVMLSEDEVTCIVDGPGKLLGLEASNNSDMGDYSDNVQRVYHGRLIAYIQSTGNSGKINLKFSSPWMKEAKLAIEVVE